MIYVGRDNKGAISEIHLEATPTAQEALPADNPELLKFIHDRSKQNELLELDRDFVRVIEDTIELLIAKDVILFTDLPPMVQQKFLRRREVRQSLNFNTSYGSEESDIIPL